MFSRVWNACKRVVSSAVDYVSSKCAKVWNSITGKSYANEAESIIADVEHKYDQAKDIYEKEVRRISDSIEGKISKINLHKQTIYTVHFERFITLARRLHNVTVKGQPFDELFDASVLEIKHQSGVRTKSEIMLIDFNQMDMLDTLGMVLTLGFFSRKKAKESLERAKKESVRVDEEIAKMEAQPIKLKVIEESIDNVVIYFDELISNYSKLLDRFEYGIQTQRTRMMANSTDVFAHKLDFKLLPIVHLEEFRALFNLSIVLKQMANLGYLSQSGGFIESDSDQAKAVYDMCKSQALCA